MSLDSTKWKIKNQHAHVKKGLCRDCSEKIAKNSTSRCIRHLKLNREYNQRSRMKEMK